LTLFALGSTGALAQGDLEKGLIKLDRMWGEATKPEELKKMLLEKFILVDGDGISTRQQLMNEMAKEASPAAPYAAADYTFHKIDDNNLVMVHSAGSGKDKHWSMHVWHKADGKWRVVASSSAAAND
jgi:hypothetical protein